MSDDFDKEAEREKLRKRFEEDKEDRESAQRMSDLLLKGATMTNKHCNECGDPVFRQNGQEFCPTCQQPVQGNEGDTTEAETDQGATDSEQSRSRPEPQAERQAATADHDRQPSPDRTPGQPREPTSADIGSRESEPRANAATTGDSVGAARTRLAEAIEVHATHALDTDDPSAATEHLEAAREAAEALAALRRSQ